MIELQLTICPFDFVFIFDFIEIKGIKRNARKNRIIIFFPFIVRNILWGMSRLSGKKEWD